MKYPEQIRALEYEIQILNEAKANGGQPVPLALMDLIITYNTERIKILKGLMA